MSSPVPDPLRPPSRFGRRRFLGLVAVSVGAAAGGVAVVRALRTEDFALGDVVAGPGPYGALGEPDANGIQLPPGFTSRVIARTGDPIGESAYTWHTAPDGGACFATPDGGWVYVSNSEVDSGGGGVGAIRFASDGTIVDAYSILDGTDRNCAGGPTPWGTWLSCEENGSIGQVYECDPFSPGKGTLRAAMGSFNHEAVSVDPATGRLYLTEDDPVGRLYRFTPERTDDLSSGLLEAASVTGTAVTWLPTSADEPDRRPETAEFDGGEGTWIHGRSLFFTTKGTNRVYELALDTQQLTVLYDANVVRDAPLTGVDNLTAHAESGDLFVAEDAGNMEICVIARIVDRREVAPFLRLLGQGGSEITGPAFSPDGTRLYFSSQRATETGGITYEVTGPFRTDTDTLSPAVGPLDSAAPASTSTTAAPTTSRTTLVAEGATWRYLDDGSDPGPTWATSEFDDSGWRSGAAPLGYGDPVTTEIDPGPDPENKRITTWFRHTFTATAAMSALELRLRRDDGAVVYLNGAEVARSNMPEGEITAETLSVSTVNDADETAFVTIPVAARPIDGDNVLAVAVHQAAPTSSDLAFDLALTGAD